MKLSRSPGRSHLPPRLPGGVERKSLLQPVEDTGPSSYLLLVAGPGAPSRVLAPSSNARSP